MKTICQILFANGVLQKVGEAIVEIKWRLCQSNVAYGYEKLSALVLQSGQVAINRAGVSGKGIGEHAESRDSVMVKCIAIKRYSSGNRTIL